MEINGQTLTPEQELGLLGSIPPKPLLCCLQVVGCAEDVFVGFRRSVDSLKLSPVRQRLQRELAMNVGLQECLWALWRESHEPLLLAVSQQEPDSLPGVLPALVQQWGVESVRLALLADEREAARRLAEQAGAVAASESAGQARAAPERAGDRQVARLREQVRTVRRGLGEQIRDLRSRLAHKERQQISLQSQLDEALRTAEKWRAAASGSAREAAEQRRIGERHARQLERTQKTSADLDARLRESLRNERRLRSDVDALRRQGEQQSRELAKQKAALPAAKAWLDAAQELIRKGQAPSAVNILAPLVQKHPRAYGLREALADAYLAVGATAAAATQLCWLARWHGQQGEVDLALHAACRALSHAPKDREALNCLQELLAGFGAEGHEEWAAAGRRLSALATQSPDAHRAAMDRLPLPLRRAAAAAQSLQAPVGLDTVLQWPLESGSFPASLRAIFAAIDASRSEVVRRVRRSLALLRVDSPEAHAAVLQAVRSHDDSYCTVLVQRTRPVAVDGSNVAWHECEGTGRPRLAHLQTIRRGLRAMGYFPIRIYVDAALVHQVDRPEELRAMVDRGEVLMADAGTDADEQILRDARDEGCAVVTNDRMDGHPLTMAVRKIRFEVSPEGAVIRG